MVNSKKRILLVDDDLDIQEVFTEILSSEGYEVTTASNGNEAMSVLREHPECLPHLIILDSQMPVMDGREFLKTIREQESEDLKRISILFNSGNGPEEDDGIPTDIRRIMKPVELTALVDSVARAIH